MCTSHCLPGRKPIPASQPIEYQSAGKKANNGISLKYFTRLIVSFLELAITFLHHWACNSCFMTIVFFLRNNIKSIHWYLLARKAIWLYQLSMALKEYAPSYGLMTKFVQICSNNYYISNALRWCEVDRTLGICKFHLQNPIAIHFVHIGWSRTAFQ